MNIQTLFSGRPLLLFAVWAVLVAALFFISHKLRASRKGRLKTLTAKYGRGWFFSEKGGSAVQMFDKTGFDFFKKNSGGHAENFIKEINTPYSSMEYFEYSYDEYEPMAVNEADKYYRRFFSCVLAEIKDGTMPEFNLEPETLLTKAGEKLGASRKDIDFEEAPVFSDNYYLYGKDESAIRNFFNMNVIHSFERNKGFHVYASGKNILVFVQRTGADKVYEFIEKSIDLVSVLGMEAKKRF